MSRIVQLNALKQGISRIRTKGGADPATLYDLVNGYVTIDGSVRSRPGTTKDVELPAGTKGLCAYNGGMVVFCHESKTITDAGYTCETLTNPNDASDPIAEIHFAGPFLGYLYVVAEFESGDVFHYWLQGGETWAADTVYRSGDIVQPSTPNGLAYRASRMGSANPSWAPSVPRTVGDVVEPTVYNDYFYTVVEVNGTNPASGTLEPDWPTSDGAQVIENTDNDAGDGGAGTTQPPSGNQPGSGTTDRYGKGVLP